jgi:ribonuclease HII
MTGIAHDGDAPVSPHEQHAWVSGRVVIGIDEVGRGAWAGPVTVAAVALDPLRLPAGARDSKRLSPRRREHLAATIHRDALVGIGSATNDEVDTHGLAAALTAAARRAFAAVLGACEAPEHPLVLVDGPHDFLRVEGADVVTIVRGDAAAISIAAASIVAKVDRDDLMVGADVTHPGYGFAHNRGYGSPEHAAALERLGACSLHRTSWAPIQRSIAPRLAFPVAP